MQQHAYLNAQPITALIVTLTTGTWQTLDIPVHLNSTTT